MSDTHSKKRKHDADAAATNGKKVKLSKEEKKAAKKLKKEAEIVPVVADKLIEAQETPGKVEECDKAAAKAAKKARKAERKAQKAAAQSEPVSNEVNGLEEGASSQQVRDWAQEQKEARTRMIMNGVKQEKKPRDNKIKMDANDGEEEDGGVKLEVSVQNGVQVDERENHSNRRNGKAEADEIVSVRNGVAGAKLEDSESDSDSSDGGVAVKDKKKKRDTKSEKKVASRARKAPFNYEAETALTELPQQDVDNFLNLNHIKVGDPSASDESALRPILDFKYLPKAILESRIKDVFQKYKTPTPIQAASWPYLLSGRDVVGIAETGSGKTLAFGLGCISSVKRNIPGTKRQVQAVIVSPTRELASQIHDQLQPLAKAFQLDTVCVYGGVPKDPQREALKKAHIVIATPGRLMDFCEEKVAELKHAKYVVLDEADRMLDQGFKDAIDTIFSKCASIHKGRQTAMFTATWPQSVRELARSYMTNPVQINIGAHNPNAELRANKNVTQRVEVLDSFSKEGRLRELVREYSPSNSNNRNLMSDNRILIFCLYKKECDRVDKSLRKMLSGAVKGIACLHGDMSQAMRHMSLNEFKNGNIPILVATDVAARGLDIPDVKLVINYTFPLTAEDYVHRIGRTGRAGKEGLAVTLFTDAEKHLAGELVNVLRAADQEVPEELLRYDLTVKKKEHGAYGRFFREVREGEKAVGTRTVFE